MELLDSARPLSSLWGYVLQKQRDVSLAAAEERAEKLQVQLV
jgi:hypothetical protein